MKATDLVVGVDYLAIWKGHNHWRVLQAPVRLYDTKDGPRSYADCVKVLADGTTEVEVFRIRATHFQSTWTDYEYRVQAWQQEKELREAEKASLITLLKSVGVTTADEVSLISGDRVYLNTPVIEQLWELWQKRPIS